MSRSPHRRHHVNFRRSRQYRSVSLWTGTPWESPHLELSVYRTHRLLGAHITIGAEEENVGFDVSLWPLTAHVKLSDAFSLPYEWFDHCGGRVTGWSLSHDIDISTKRRWQLHDAMLSCRIWSDETMWCRSQLDHWPWQKEGWKFSLRPFEFLFGALDTEEDHRGYQTFAVTVPMPEGDYEATVELHRVRWTRRFVRGPWGYNVRIEVEDGIPVPGKGTTAYNCGDDAVYSLAFRHEGTPDPDEIASHLVDDCMESRVRYGGLGWEPEDGWPTERTPPPAAEQ